MHCCQRCERFAAFPAFPTTSLVALRDRTPYRLGRLPGSDSCASFAIGIAASEPERRVRLVRFRDFLRSIGLRVGAWTSRSAHEHDANLGAALRTNARGFRILLSHSRSAPHARPVRRQAAGWDARCLAHPFSHGSTMHRATTRGSNATGRTITQVHIASRTEVNGAQFRFRDFWRSRRGHIWRVDRSTTPFLAPPRPSASSACKPTRPYYLAK